MIRRRFRTVALAAPLTPVVFTTTLGNALAEDWRHAGALNGKPKYEKGFAHFDYEIPQAPTGGKVVFGTVGSFDTFNPILPTGEQAPGLSVLAANFLYETLTKPSMDEADISAEYGLIAEAMKYPDDYSSVTFQLNPKAKWHDGVPITAEDVIWSFEQQKALHPRVGFYYSSVDTAEQTGEREVTFRFKEKNNRELPKIMGQLNVLPKHWWTGKNAKGEDRDLSKSTLEAPLGSGPYKIGKFQTGRFIEYERVPDAWANDLNVNIGYYNFDKLRYEMYKDSTVIVEAFKAGETDWRTENSASNWVNRYNTDARERGDIILETKPDIASGVMQGYVFNTRSEIFKDRRVRQALELAFDFGTLNRTLLSNLYFQPDSYFAGSELASEGLPSEAELKYLEPLRDQLPAEVFTERYTLPVTGSEKAMRANYRKALGLLKVAGWELNKKRQLVNKETGKPMVIRYADYTSPLNEKTVLALKKDMKRIGVEIEYLPTDIPTYINKRNSFDFDMMVSAWGQSLSPGNEQREYWSTASSTRKGSRNYAGIADPAVDALIEKIIFAPNRDELVAATKALDRVLLAGHYVIPQFFYPFDRFARWNLFSHANPLPEYAVGFPDIWWYDEEKAATVKR